VQNKRSENTRSSRSSRSRRKENEDKSGRGKMRRKKKRSERERKRERRKGKGKRKNTWQTGRMQARKVARTKGDADSRPVETSGKTRSKRKVLGAGFGRGCVRWSKIWARASSLSSTFACILCCMGLPCVCS